MLIFVQRSALEEPTLAEGTHSQAAPGVGNPHAAIAR